MGNAVQKATRSSFSPVQLKSAPEGRGPESASGSNAAAVAEAGFSDPATSYPFLDQIQASFGGHDVSGISAFSGEAAGESAQALGANAYAMGDNVAFAGAPDLHTAAHEAAHVVQQQQGVSLSGGMGQAGDQYEQHADAVADAVVAGESAEALLGASPGGGGGTGVQRDEVNPGDDGVNENAGIGNIVKADETLIREAAGGDALTPGHDDARRSVDQQGGETSRNDPGSWPKEVSATYRTPPWYFYPPFYLQGSVSAGASFGLEGGMMASDIGTEAFLGGQATVSGDLDLGMGAASGIMAVGGNVSLDGELKLGGEVKLNVTKGFENGIGLSGKIEGGFNAFVEIMGWRHEIPLSGIEVGKLDLTYSYNAEKGSMERSGDWGIQWTFVPREADILPPNEFSAWLNADDTAAAQVKEAVENGTIDDMPVSLRAELLSSMNSWWLDYSHEELALSVLGIYEGNDKELSDTAWEVLEKAFENARGRRATGFTELHQWLTGTGGLSGSEQDQFNNAASSDGAQHLVDIQLKGNLVSSGPAGGYMGMEITGLSPISTGWFSTYVNGVTADLSGDDHDEVIQLLDSKRYDDLVRGVTLSSGTGVRASIHVTFLGRGAGSIDYRNGKFSAAGVQDESEVETAFRAADIYV